MNKETKEPVVPFGQSFASILDPSKRVDCSILISEGWNHYSKWPYDNPGFNDIMNYYEKENLCVVSCDLFSCVYQGDDNHAYFETIEQLRDILKKL